MRSTYRYMFLVLVLTFAGSAQAGKYFGVMMMLSCSAISDDYHAKVEAHLANWRSLSPDFDTRLGDFQLTDVIPPKVRKEFSALSAEDKQRIQAQCDQGLIDITREFEAQQEQLLAQ